MIRVEIEHTFPVSVGEAFGYITDTSNWAEYWPDFVRVQDPASARWANPGDEITIVLRLLGRERAMHMKLKEFQTDALVTYVSNQRGLPDAGHERYFKAVPGGVEYRVVVSYEPRSGITGLFDRFYVKRAVEQKLRKTIGNLDRRLRKQGQRG